MVDYDPRTGKKGRTLRALAKYRRRNGQITFGHFLKLSMDAGKGSANSDNDNDKKLWLAERDQFRCIPSETASDGGSSKCAHSSDGI
mmetsp:Transcript_11316/g.32511  ORF Transcript_11316/g.32511 Transcript_11316/m.32511 type:complete len:87 (-) Transcript_11316:685-945(-)